MSILRRLVPFSFGASSLTGVGHFMFNWSKGSTISSSLLEKIYSISENVKDVSLNKELDSRVEDSSSPFLYSLMSANLYTFSNSFKEYFYRWALFKWGDAFLKKTSNSIFVSPKINIFNEFIRLKRSYNPNFSNEFGPKNWTNESYIIHNSKDILDKAFEEVFFKTLYINNKDNNISIVADKSQFGGDGYIDKVAEFQKFVYKKWKEQENPLVFCRKNWKYGSEFGSENIYKKDSSGIIFPTAPNFRFSDFNENKEKIKEFLKNMSEKGTCENDDFKIYTTTEMSKNKDGWEISAFLHRLNNESDNSSKLKKKEESDYSSKDPMELFVADNANDFENGGGNNYKISLKQEIISDKGPLKNHKDKKVLSFRDVKVSGDKGYGTYVRTSEGLTYLYESNNHKDIDKFFFGEESKKIKESDLITILKSYWKTHGFELLGGYLSSDEGKKGGGIFLDRTWDSSLYDLAENVSKFLFQLEKNKIHWTLLTSLSSAVKDFEDIKFENKQENKQENNAGLAVPLQISRNLDMNSELSEVVWISENKENKENKNDGDFPLLKSYLKQEGRKRLYDSSSLIKDNIGKYINILWIRTKEKERSSYFLGDYIFDNIYHDFKSKEEILKKTTSNIFLINYLGFDFFKNGIQEFSSKLAAEVGKSDSLAKLIKDSIIEVFYGSNYLSESLEHRLNYGGYKFQEKNQEEKCEISQVAEAEAEAEKCKKYRENYQQKQIKLHHYWVDKNYFFNEYGYEISSQESTDYIRFLFSLKWLIGDKFKFFREIGSTSISADGYGALVWLDRVEQATQQAKMGESSQESKTEVIKDFDIYFKDNKKDVIFNPFFSSSIDIPGPDSGYPLTTGNVTAFLKKDNKYVELAGYQGFISEFLNYKQLPDRVAKALFDEFSKSNPKNNKSYHHTTEDDSDAVVGSAFGYSSGNIHLDAETLIDSMNTLFSIKRFLSLYLPKKNGEFLSWISDLDSKNLDSVDPAGLTLEKAKEKAKELVKGEETKNGLKKAMTRFSGFLQNFDIENSIFSNQKYFIADSNNSNKGYIAYVFQVNKYDFGEGFSEFVRLIGVRTLFKTIAMLSLNDLTKSSSANSYLLKQGVVI